MSGSGDITQLLDAWSRGERAALDRLLPLVYAQLRRIARHYMSQEQTGHTLNTTALVHEAYVRLAQLERIRWQDRVHFFAIAARMMRRVLIRYAERRKADKREGERTRLALDDVVLVTGEDLDGLLALDEALRRLEVLNERQVRVVECRFFSGLSVEETAEALGVSTASVKRDWSTARAWLNRELG